MKLEKIKLKNIIDEQLTNDELELLKGGTLPYGCHSGACTTYVQLVEHNCKQGHGVCNSGIT